ncbi:MAG: DUF368 domain-containing protein [Enterocloster sp.]
MEKNGKTFIKGLVIGATMTVPGVSGGSMAMVLGIYDRLLKHVSEITKYPKESLTFLLWFAAGAGSGAFLFSRGISWLLTTRAEGILCFFFLGAVSGGIPMILKSASVSRIRGRELICILTGILTALLIALIPQGIFAPGTENTPMHLLFQLAGGFIIAVALVLPGISASQMLYMLGIYESTLKAISSLDILALLPLAVGGIMGTYLTARILEQLIKKHREDTFLMILGFMLVSLRSLLPEHLAEENLLAGVGALVLGFVSLYFLSAK